MVVASADAIMDLCKLADMADKVMEVAMPSVSAVSDTPTDAVGVRQLPKEIVLLADFVTSLSTLPHC